jgi:hypothetical protein
MRLRAIKVIPTGILLACLNTYGSELRSKLTLRKPKHGP